MAPRRARPKELIPVNEFVLPPRHRPDNPVKFVILCRGSLQSREHVSLFKESMDYMAQMAQG